MRAADLRDTVLAQISDKSRPTYGIGIRRLCEEFADREIDTIRLPELENLRDRVRREAGQAKVDRARRVGRRLASYDPDAHGKGAAENFVRATRFFFRYAQRMDLITTDPAVDLKVPRRGKPPERPLLEHELADIWRAVHLTSNDLELDSLLLGFIRHTAARREGCINLTVDHLNRDEESVTLNEKFGDTRVLPLQRSVIDSLLVHAHTRGSSLPGDAVFRYRNGNALTKRRFNTIFDHVDAVCGWTEPLDVGAHWLRHTTLADIAAVSDLRVAAAYAGHSMGSLDVIYRYTQVTFEDLRNAYHAVFGDGRG